MKHEHITAAGVLFVIGALGGTAGVISTVEALRWWAPREAFEEVAADFYGLKAEIYEWRRSRAESELTACRADPDGRCWSEARKLREIDRDIAESQELKKYYEGR